MKYIAICCILVLTITLGCNNIPEKKVDLSKIENVLNAQVKEWQACNIDGFMKGYWHSDSLKFITKRGIKMGYDSVCMNYKKYYDTPEKMGHLTFSDLKFDILDSHGELVQCTGKWKIEGKTPETNQAGIFSLIFRDMNGEWKIIVDHTW